MNRRPQNESGEHYEPTPSPAPAPGVPEVPEQKLGGDAAAGTSADVSANRSASPRAQSGIHIPKGESQWAIVWRQFRKRRLAVLAAAAIWTIITVAIWAPFIASNRPLMYIGYNRQEYQESARTARIMLSQFIDQNWTNADIPWTDWRQDQVEILALQLNLMSEQLAELEREALAQFRESVYQAVAVDDPQNVDIETLRDLRIELRRTFDGRRVSFRYLQYWPVFRSLSAVEVAFMLWNLSVFLWPVWAKLTNVILFKGERRPTPPAIRAAMLAGLPILAAVLWHFLVPERLDRTNYKNAVFSHETDKTLDALVVYEGVLWPPIQYGLDEDHLTRKFAKPVLIADDEVSDDDMRQLSAEARAKKVREELGRWDTPHWLGTDEIGRDVLTRMIWGGRISLAVGIVAVSIYVTIGIIVGSIAGYFRGTPDMIISRIIEVVICFPSFFLILSIVAFLGPNIFNIMIVIGVTGWTGIARLVRAEFLRLVDQEFVLAGRALGYSPWRIIFRHVLPNAMAPVLVSATFGIAGAILTESALSFLGFGITVPTPSWGGILSSGREAIFRAPWLIYFPGTAIFITITAYNLVGEALRDAADPRLRN